MIPARLCAALESRLGVSIVDARARPAGDISHAHVVRLADARRVFVKTHDSAPPGMFEAEAEGLRWLADAGALPVPAVLAAGPGFLVLELLEPGARLPDHDERLGRGLAALHRASPGRYGLDHDNFVGRLPQANAACPDWPEFYRSRRLEPQLRMAFDSGWVDVAIVRAFERLFARLSELVGEPEAPSRLHGDLWAGNVHVGPDGGPVLIDPAVYGGHREVDLAMMRLFGGFSSRVFAAYAEAWPLAPGHAERVPLYQLYPLLVHVNLFAGAYVGSLSRALRRYAGGGDLSGPGP